MYFYQSVCLFAFFLPRSHGLRGSSRGNSVRWCFETRLQTVRADLPEDKQVIFPFLFHFFFLLSSQRDNLTIEPALEPRCESSLSYSWCFYRNNSWQCCQTLTWVVGLSHRVCLLRAPCRLMLMGTLNDLRGEVVFKNIPASPHIHLRRSLDQLMSSLPQSERRTSFVDPCCFLNRRLSGFIHWGALCLPQLKGEHSNTFRPYLCLYRNRRRWSR